MLRYRNNDRYCQEYNATICKSFATFVKQCYTENCLKAKCHFELNKNIHTANAAAKHTKRTTATVFIVDKYLLKCRADRC